ncbi:MAG: hypothetical protein ACRD43_13755, partial [Pyrinomonadaceae bacterium]
QSRKVAKSQKKTKKDKKDKKECPCRSEEHSCPEIVIRVSYSSLRLCGKPFFVLIYETKKNTGKRDISNE